jgi:hypothetical protein
MGETDMLLDALLAHPWLAIALWAVIYISDYTLTIVGARLHRDGANRHHEIQGYELTPIFQQDIAKLRLVSPRFIIMLLVTSSLLLFAFLLARDDRQLRFIPACLLGYFILQEVAVHVRHIRNIAAFRLMMQSKGIAGKIPPTSGTPIAFPRWRCWNGLPYLSCAIY